MKRYAIIFGMMLLFAACLVFAIFSPDRSLKASTDAAVQQTQQQKDNLQAAMVNETAVQGQSDANIQALDEAASAAQEAFSAQAASDNQAADVNEAQATADAQAILSALQEVQSRATAQALSYQLTAQVIEAQAIANAQGMLLLQQQAQTTATAQAMAALQTVQAVEAKATVDARAVLLAQQQTQTEATAQVMERERLDAEQSAATSGWLRSLMSWFIWVIAACALALVVFIGVKLIGELIDQANEARSAENQNLTTVVEVTRTETITANQPPAELAAPRRLNVPVNYTSASPAVVMLANYKRFLAGRAEAGEVSAQSKLMMKLLRDAIDSMGAKFDRIPSAAQLGWPAAAWAIAVAFLKPYGVEIRRDTTGGTNLGWEYPTLQALYNAIGERRIIFIPHWPKKTPIVLPVQKGK